jgi:hypothetical protein
MITNYQKAVRSDPVISRATPLNDAWMRGYFGCLAKGSLFHRWVY